MLAWRVARFGSAPGVANALRSAKLGRHAREIGHSVNAGLGSKALGLWNTESRAFAGDDRRGASLAPYACALRFCRLPTRSSTTVGSARVEVSPRLPYSSSAILRRILRMILPERVFGRPGANWIGSGEAIGPISLRTQAISSLRRSSLGFSPAISVT